MSVTQITPEEAATISKLGKTISAARIALTVGIGIAVSDYFETLSREVRFFWRGKVTVPRTLYFIIRYANFVIQILNLIAFFNPPSDHFCEIYINTQLVAALLLIWSTQSILIIRITAVYATLWLNYALWIILGLAAISEATFVFVSTNLHPDWRAQPFPTLYPSLRYCVPVATVRDVLQNVHYLSWVPTLVIDSIVFLLALLKFIQFRTHMTPAAFQRSLMWTVLHDSIVYYFLLLAISLTYIINARINVENSQPVSNINLPLVAAAGVRLLFRIRTSERARVLGIDDADAPAPGLSGYMTDNFTAPIMFRVFPQEDRHEETEFTDVNCSYPPPNLTQRDSHPSNEAGYR